MSNLGINAVKVGLLVGGAIAGLWLSNKFDEILLKWPAEQPQHDQDYYAQGLTPVQPKVEEQTDK